MKSFLALLTVMTIVFNCSDDINKSSEINIRLSNISDFNFQNIIVNTSTGNVSFENIDSGQITDYKTFETAYRYAFVELEIDGETYTIQPIDYVGETPLENANYTYQINANDSQEQYGRLALSIIKD